MTLYDFVPKRFDEFVLVIGYNSRVFYPIMHESFQFVLGPDFFPQAKYRKELRIECTCNKTSTDDKEGCNSRTTNKEKSPPSKLFQFNPQKSHAKRKWTPGFPKKKVAFLSLNNERKNNKAFDGICEIMFRITKLFDPK